VREAKPADRAERARRHAIIAARHGWTPVLERFLAVYAEVLALHRSARR
jgi:hypothetical protein